MAEHVTRQPQAGALIYKGTTAIAYPGPEVDGRNTWFCRLDEVRPPDEEYRIWDDEVWTPASRADSLSPKAWVQVRATDPHIAVKGGADLLRKSQLRRQIATMNDGRNMGTNYVPVDKTADVVWAWLEERLG